VQLNLFFPCSIWFPSRSIVAVPFCRLDVGLGISASVLAAEWRNAQAACAARFDRALRLLSVVLSKIRPR
jgi:hypothetical protein